MKCKILKKLTGLVLAAAMTLSLVPVETRAQVNNYSQNIYNYTKMPNEAWSQKITLKENEFYAILLTPEIDQTWTFESRGSDDTYLKLAYYDEQTKDTSYVLEEVDEGGETVGNFKLTYDLKAGNVYSLYISGFADSACTTTVYGTPHASYAFKAISEKTFMLDSPDSTGSKYPSSCNLEVGLMNQFDNNTAGNVGWFYIDDDGKEKFLLEENIHPGEGQTSRYTVNYSNLINGKTVVYFARCSFLGYQQDVLFQVTGCTFDSGLEITSYHCPDYVNYDQEATLSVGCISTNSLGYQWYRYDYEAEKYVEIPDAIFSSYTCPAYEYARIGKVLYQCRVNDGFKDLTQTFELQVNEPRFDDNFSVAADHNTMKPGDTNRLYITTKPYYKMGSYMARWSKWNEETDQYEEITNAHALTYTITAEESKNFTYGKTLTYRCRIIDENNSIVDLPIQIAISPLRDDQVMSSFYFDPSIGTLRLETENYESIDPTGSYSYEWTIEGNDNSNCSDPVAIGSDDYYHNLTPYDMDLIDGEYIITCRATDLKVNKSSLYRAKVYYNSNDHFKVYYKPEAVMDYTNGTDLHVITAEDDNSTSQIMIMYEWYRNGTLISGETKDTLHINPSDFNLFDIYICRVSDRESTVDCKFTLFNQEPVKDDDFYPDPPYDDWSTKISCNLDYKWDITQLLDAGSSYVVQFTDLHPSSKRKTYEITVTGNDYEIDLEYALYDDEGERLNIASKQEAGNIWIRFESTGSFSYNLYLYNNANSSITRSIGSQSLDVTTDDESSEDIYFRNYDSLLMPVTNPTVVDFNWGLRWSELQKSCETVFLVDGRIVQRGYDLKSMVPSLTYDMNNDRVEDITLRVKYNGYWHESTTRVYFTTLLWEASSPAFNTKTLEQAVTAAQNQKIELDCKPKDKWSIFNKLELKNLNNSLTAIWYKTDDPEASEDRTLTKVGEGEKFIPDTSTIGTSYYVAEITNGIDTCTMTIELEVVVPSGEGEDEISISGLGMTVFDSGLLDLNVYLQIPASMVNDNYTVNDKYLDELEFYGTVYEAKTVYSVYKLSFSISPAELGSCRSVSIYDNENRRVVFMENVSAVKYLNLLLNDEEFREENPQYDIYTEFAKKLVIYGNASREYFKNNGDVSIIDILSGNDSMNREIPADVMEAYSLPDDYLFDISNGIVPGISYYGSSLILDSDTRIRHYFNLDKDRDISNYTFKCNDQIIHPIKKGNLYYVEIGSIPVNKLGDAYTLTLSTKEGRYTKSTTLSYSVMNYLSRWYNSGPKETEANLIKSLYWFYTSWPSI